MDDSPLGVNVHLQDCGREVIEVGFKREMAGVQQPDIRIGHVALERLGVRRNEEGVVLPHIANSGGRCVRRY